MADGDISKALLARVRQRIGEASSVNGVLDEDIYCYLNSAQQDLVWRLHDAAMPELSEMVTGNMSNSRIPLPADFLREVTVQVTSDYVMARVWPVSQIDALQENVLHTPSPTNPYYYVWYSGTDAAVRLHVDIGVPNSNAAYRLRYIKRPPDMGDSADPVFSTDKHSLIVEFAVMLHHMTPRGEPAEVERLWRNYLSQIVALNTRYAPGFRFEGRASDVADVG